MSNTYRMVAGRGNYINLAGGATTYLFPMGLCESDATPTNETPTSFKVYENVTLSDFFTYVRVNSRTEASTLRTRRNGANGGLSVSVPASTTGTFEDTSGSDSLVNGDVFNYQASIGSGGSEFLIYQIAVVATSGNVVVGAGRGQTAGYYSTIVGTPQNWASSPNETQTKYTFRTATTIDKLRIYVRSNSVGATRNYYSRINGGNGNLAVSVGAGQTGSFEDASNSDSVAVGQDVNISHDAQGGDSQTATVVQLRSNRPQSGGGHAQIGSPGIRGTGYFLPIASDLSNWGGTESYVALKVRMTSPLCTFFVRVGANNLNSGTTTVRTRKNSANGALSVSISAGATGAFEYTSNSETLAATDTLDINCDTGGTSGTISFSVIAFQQGLFAPTVTTQAATDVTQTTATGNGNITDTGGENCDERGVEWGTTNGGPYPNSATDTGSFGTGAFTKGMTGLTNNTTYYYRAKAHNSAGWGYGAQQNFTTLTR